MSNYRKGADYERKIVNELRAQGFVCARSAGSKSPIDIWAVNPETREMLLIQAKKGKPIPKGEKLEILEFFKHLNGEYVVSCELWED